jgi:hypothetical protein
MPKIAETMCQTRRQIAYWGVCARSGSGNRGVSRNAIATESSISGRRGVRADLLCRTDPATLRELAMRLVGSKQSGGHRDEQLVGVPNTNLPPRLPIEAGHRRLADLHCGFVLVSILAERGDPAGRVVTGNGGRAGRLGGIQQVSQKPQSLRTHQDGWL